MDFILERAVAHGFYNGLKDRFHNCDWFYIAKGVAIGHAVDYTQHLSSGRPVIMEAARGVRITTWNVNGIRNPFGHQPWRQVRTFAAMFDILQADIVVMQETKIQRKDLQDDMVLVPGWDVYFSLPKQKKGYSGVAVYTRNSICSPIRAEEGITGILTPPNSTTSFRDIPKEQQIGGYLTPHQLSACGLDAAMLDSEGRCVVLEFPAFVLVGTYCPAYRDRSRDEFRLGFLNAVDFRVRNLVDAGKRVFLTGDLNIAREELDTANAEDQMRKLGITTELYISTPPRRLLNQLLVGGKVIGDRDEGRLKPVMWDICRSFHPTRKGMFTCWEQKINARPGNFGSRIDYVLCSEEWKDWFCDSNIQEGLMGSDHCPVYAVIKQKVEIDGLFIDIRDLMSAGMFKDGIQQREWSTKDLLPMSAKLIPEFSHRRSIKDMFLKEKPPLTKKSSLPCAESRLESGIGVERVSVGSAEIKEIKAGPQELNVRNSLVDSIYPLSMETQAIVTKRTSEACDLGRDQKRSRSSASKAASKCQHGKGQISLLGFLRPKSSQPENRISESPPPSISGIESASLPAPALVSESPNAVESADDSFSHSKTHEISVDVDDGSHQKDIVDPITSKEDWSKILVKREVPRCGHNEPCVSLVTKKPGVNCGRSFFICPRPLGPAGRKEKNSEWRCGTFIWSSDWAD